MLIPYRKIFDVVGATWFADLYCAQCADTLSDIDPEGNPKHPVFLSDLDELEGHVCGSCFLPTSEW